MFSNLHTKHLRVQYPRGSRGRHDDDEEEDDVDSSKCTGGHGKCVLLMGALRLVVPSSISPSFSSPSSIIASTSHLFSVLQLNLFVSEGKLALSCLCFASSSMILVYNRETVSFK